MNKLTKRKWMAILGFTEVCCPKCGNNLASKGYYNLECTKCNYKRYESDGHFWSLDSTIRKDPYIDKFTGKFKK